MNLSDLSAEFPKPAVHWRVQGKPYQRGGSYYAMALAYIDARDVMDRLDEVCGPHNWQSEFTETPSGRVLCRIGIRFGDDWVWKTDGAGGTQVEAEKGGISDALKRAAVSWGVGRYLYRLDSPWVACEVNVKGDKTYWKRWTEDPWSKVKVVGYQKPETPEPKFNAIAARDRIKKKIQNSEVLDELVNVWKSEGEDIARLKKEDPPKYAELNAAKDARKAELQHEEAA